MADVGAYQHLRRPAVDKANSDTTVKAVGPHRVIAAPAGATQAPLLELGVRTDVVRYRAGSSDDVVLTWED